MTSELRSFTKPDGASLGYTVLSGGSPSPSAATLVCHPGGPGFPATYFGDLCGLASERLRVVLFNPRGTGASSLPSDGRYDLEEYAADVDALRAHLGAERIDFLGHSHGGFVGMVYALAYPERLGRLVLACTTPRFSRELKQEGEAALAARSGQPWFDDAVDAQRRCRARDYRSREELAALYAREFRLRFWECGPAAEAFIEMIKLERPDPEALHYFNDRLARGYDLRPRLFEIRAPTLIVNGEADPFGPQISARELAAIPGSRVVIIPRAGHFPFVEAPERFRVEIEAFLVGTG